MMPPSPLVPRRCQASARAATRRNPYLDLLFLSDPLGLDPLAVVDPVVLRARRVKPRAARPVKPLPSAADCGHVVSGHEVGTARVPATIAAPPCVSDARSRSGAGGQAEAVEGILCLMRRISEKLEELVQALGAVANSQRKRFWAQHETFRPDVQGCGAVRSGLSCCLDPSCRRQQRRVHRWEAASGVEDVPGRRRDAEVGTFESHGQSLKHIGTGKRTRTPCIFAGIATRAATPCQRRHLGPRQPRPSNPLLLPHRQRVHCFEPGRRSDAEGDLALILP